MMIIIMSVVAIAVGIAVGHIIVIINFVVDDPAVAGDALNAFQEMCARALFSFVE